MRKLYPYFLLVLSVLTFTQSKAQVNKNDSLALVDLYNSTNGPGWTNHTNWLTSAPVNTWFGISYDLDSQRVYAVNLHSNNLNGTIPASIGKLRNLYTLYLYDNTLHESIPANLGQLKKLKYLNLARNQLSGSIPIKLSNLSNIYSFNLQDNQLSGGIPSDLSKLSKLELLYLDNNSLGGTIPATLGNSISPLQVLSLSNNRLVGNIPGELGYLWHLYNLNLENNNLTGGIPLSLTFVSSLRYLFLDNNKLTGEIPAGLGESQITDLRLNNNHFSGEISMEFNSSRSLTILDVSNNELSGTVPSLSSDKGLDRLHLEGNKFTFNGLESIASTFRFATYSPQANLTIKQNGNLLSVDAGGTISNNTYKWYRNGKLYRTKVGNANITASNDGAYTVEVTNAVATQLTLKSDTVNYAAFSNVITSAVSNTSKSAYIFPNPATTVTTVYFTAIGKYTITVTDASGKVMKTKTDVAANYHNYIQLEVNGYASGIYLISISDEKGLTQTLKLIKE